MDLSHALADGRAHSGTSPPPRIGALVDHLLTRGQRAPHSADAAVEGLNGMATCLHAPAGHRAQPPDLGSLVLEDVAGVPGLVVTVDPSSREIGAEAIGSDVAVGDRAVLLRSGWDDRWGTASYGDPGPYLSGATADLLVRAGARIVGVDFANVDDIAGIARPIRARLLGAGIILVEHLTNLSALPPTGFRLFAVPLRIVRGSSFPVRAFAEVPR